MLAAILERTGDREQLAELLARADRGGEGPGRLGVDRVARAEARRRCSSRPIGCRRATSTTRASTGSRRAASCSTRSCACSTARATRARRRTCRSDGWRSSRAPAAEGMALALVGGAHGARRSAGGGAGARAGVPRASREPALRDRLEAAFRERSEWRKLAELCVLDASARVDAGERVARLREAAVIWRSELGDPKQAAAVAAPGAGGGAGGCGRCCAIWSTCSSRRAIRRGAAQELSSAIESVDGGGSHVRAALLAARASVRRASAGNAAGALEDLEAAFAIDRRCTRRRSRSSWSVRAPRRPQSGDAATVRVLRLRQAQVLPYAGDVEGRAPSWSSWRSRTRRTAPCCARWQASRLRVERWDAASAALRRLRGPGGGGRSGGDRAAPGRRMRARGTPGRRARSARASAPRRAAGPRGTRAAGARLRADRRVARAGGPGARGRAGERGRGGAVRAAAARGDAAARSRGGSRARDCPRSRRPARFGLRMRSAPASSPTR